jgi:hypothetical protein
LVEAIDAGVSAETLASLSEQADSHCAAALLALAAASSEQRSASAAQLAQVRTWSALANARCVSARESLGEQRSELQRARQVLALHAGTQTGDSCDISG